MKVLVTGAAGFIGSSLCEGLLARGHEVIGLDGFTDYYARALKERNLRNLRSARGFRLVEQMMAQADWPALLDGVSVVYHQAAQAGVRASWGAEFRHYTDWNVLATQQLLEAVKAAPSRPRVVYASSSSVYGERDHFPFRESDRPEPVSPYGVTKLAGEHLCVLYARNFGVESVALRYFTVYGPRQRPDMAFHKFFRAIHRGESLPLYGDGEQTRDFTFIADAVEANVLAAERGVPGAVYNVGGGSRVRLLEVFDMLGRVTGRPVELDRLPRQHGDVTHTGAATELAQRDLQWHPQVSLEDGLSRQWADMQEVFAAGL